MKTLITLLLLAAPLWAGKGYDEAVKLVKQKKYGVAQILLEAELKKNDLPKVRYALGYSLEKQGKKDEALTHYRVVVARNINKAADPTSAEKALRRMLALQPEVGPVLEAAQGLESRARKKKGAQREYLKGAARRLYAYVLNGDNWDDAKKVSASKKPLKPMAKAGGGLKAPKDAKKYRRHYYKYFPSGGISWDKAKEECETKGGTLLSVNSKAEWKWVLKNLLTTEDGARAIWLGARQGQPTWEDGSKFKLSAWREFLYSGHPWSHRADGEFRFPAWIALAGKWATVTAGDARSDGYICEWEK